MAMSSGIVPTVLNHSIPVIFVPGSIPRIILSFGFTFKSLTDNINNLIYLIQMHYSSIQVFQKTEDDV